ncbi:MAG: histidinol-phosphate aminotransferase, partial [Yoonia sp.]
WRDWLSNALAEIGVPCDTSTANFVLARFGSETEANACDDRLRAEGILIRRVGGYNLPHCLRITVGDESACRRVVHAIAQFKGAR